MKKSVVIIIALIYIASIALVSFFGLQYKVFDEVIPVEITNEGQKLSETHGDYIVIRPNEKGERRFKIDYHVYPENASNTTVDFAYEQVDYATVDEYGVVTFTSPGVLKVRIIATDGSNAEDTITIIAY